MRKNYTVSFSEEEFTWIVDCLAMRRWAQNDIAAPLYFKVAQILEDDEE